MKRTFFAMLLLCLFSKGSLAQDNNTQIQIDLAVQNRIAQSGKADVMIYLKDQVDMNSYDEIENYKIRAQKLYKDLARTALNTQSPLLNLLKLRGLKYESFHIVNAVAVYGLKKSDALIISQLPSVVAIRPNFAFQMTLPKSEFHPELKDPSPNDIPDHLKAIGADRAWSLGAKGQNIVVAGQDTGYAWSHPALKTKYRGYSEMNVRHDYNWHDAIHKPLYLSKKSSSCGYELQEPCDDDGHGTHTMGTILGSDGADNWIGVAPEAKWIGCRNMENGVGRASTYIECFEFFLAPYPRGGDPKKDGNPAMAPNVISNSWACPADEGCSGSEFVNVIKTLRAAGILVVASAGNEGPSCSTNGAAPGNYSNDLISAAAFDIRNNDAASFSSRGPSTHDGSVGPNLTAPGTAIRSSVPSGGLGDGLYDYKSGTSMSAPHIAGAVAVVLSARPELIGKPEAIMNLLFKTATPKTSSQNCGGYPGNAIPNAVHGYGMVDILKAIQTK